MILYFAASGGWQEPENPHTQRVSKRSLERGANKRWGERPKTSCFISGCGLCLEVLGCILVYFTHRKYFSLYSIKSQWQFFLLG